MILCLLFAVTVTIYLYLSNVCTVQTTCIFKYEILLVGGGGGVFTNIIEQDQDVKVFMW